MCARKCVHLQWRIQCRDKMAVAFTASINGDRPLRIQKNRFKPWCMQKHRHLNFEITKCANTLLTHNAPKYAILRLLYHQKNLGGTHRSHAPPRPVAGGEKWILSQHPTTFTTLSGYGASIHAVWVFALPNFWIRHCAGGSHHQSLCIFSAASLPHSRLGLHRLHLRLQWAYGTRVVAYQ